MLKGYQERMEPIQDMLKRYEESMKPISKTLEKLPKIMVAPPPSRPLDSMELMNRAAKLKPAPNPYVGRIAELERRVANLEEQLRAHGENEYPKISHPNYSDFDMYS